MNPVQILQGMAQQAAQAAAAAFQQIPATLRTYSQSGKMDADLQQFGKDTANTIYNALETVLDQKAAGLGTNLLISNLEVATTIGAVEIANRSTIAAFEAATGAQRRFADNSRRTFATVTSTLGAQMSKLTDTSGEFVASSVKRTLDQVERSNKEASTRTVETVSGIGLTLYDLLPGFAQTLQNTNQAILLDSQTYYRAGTDMTADALTNTAALQRAFGYTSAEITNFVLRDIEKTGKASGDTVMQVSAAAFAAADALGAAPRITEQQIVSMTNNVERYGNSSVSQMAAVSKQLQELSLDIGTLDKLAGAFSGFDSAISKSNDLAALFGVQLDSMEAMYLAAEDPTRLLETIREQLLEQGVDVSNMSQSQLRALSRTLGMTVEETKRYLQDGLLTPYEEAYTKIEEGTTRALEKPNDLAARAAKMAADGAAMTAEQAEQAQADKLSAATLSQSMAEVVAQSNQAISAALGEANNKQKELYSTTLKTTEEALKDFNAVMPELITQYVLPYFETSIKKIQSTFEGARKGLPVSPAPAATSPTAVAPPPPPAPAPVAAPAGTTGPGSPTLPAPAPPAPAPAASTAPPATPPDTSARAEASPMTGTLAVRVEVNSTTGEATATVTPLDFPEGVRVIVASGTA